MIRDRWYPICESRRLARRPVGARRLGRSLVLWRDEAGTVRAAPRTCPHRGADLSAGRIEGGELACPWHGFRFDAHGACTRMPCEGERAAPPPTLSLEMLPVKERHGLVWLWYGDPGAARAPVPFFDDLAERDLRATSEASYVLPYHYSRMVETNLDLHHTPFVHGSVLPGTGARIDPYDAHADGDLIRTSGVLRREGRENGFRFRADCLLPCLGLVSLGDKLHIAISATPVDDDHTWVWFRYYQDYLRDFTPAWPIGRLISWVSVRFELSVVQRQDRRIFAGLPSGTVDDADDHLIRADRGIAMYRRRRGELLAAAAGARRAG